MIHFVCLKRYICKLRTRVNTYAYILKEEKKKTRKKKTNTKAQKKTTLEHCTVENLHRIRA